MALPEYDDGRPDTERPRNVVTPDTHMVAAAATIARASRPRSQFCPCSALDIAELRLGFGCAKHALGPL